MLRTAYTCSWLKRSANYFNHRVITNATLLILASASTIGHASQVTVKIQANISSYYDYTKSAAIPITPLSGIISFTFDADQISAIDYGATTISFFGGTNETKWSSFVTNLIPNDPYSGIYGNFYNSYVFPNVSDYPGIFFEEGAAQANTYKVDGDNTSVYHIEVRATRYSSARTGDGESDYAFDKQGILDFYRSFMNSGESVSFSEYFSVYSFVDGVPIYSEGMYWGDSNAKVIEVIDHASAIPEPTTWALMSLGLLMIGSAVRRNSTPTALS
jgi:hypothetical protein